MLRALPQVLNELTASGFTKWESYTSAPGKHYFSNKTCFSATIAAPRATSEGGTPSLTLPPRQKEGVWKRQTVLLPAQIQQPRVGQYRLCPQPGDPPLGQLCSSPHSSWFPAPSPPQVPLTKGSSKPPCPPPGIPTPRILTHWITGMGSPQTMGEEVQPSVPRWAALCIIKVRKPAWKEGEKAFLKKIVSPSLISSWLSPPFPLSAALGLPGWPYVPPFVFHSHQATSCIIFHSQPLISFLSAASFPNTESGIKSEPVVQLPILQSSPNFWEPQKGFLFKGSNTSLSGRL